MSATATEAASAQNRLLKLTRRRLENHVTLLPKLLISDDPETIHDLRVASRRLQQAIRVVAPTDRAKKVKWVVRRLRQVRQILGPCRDLDTNLALLKSKRDQGGASGVQKAWQAMENDLASHRAILIERVRRDISKQDLFEFIARVQGLLVTATEDFDAVEGIAAAMTKSMDGWLESFASTREHPAEAGLHALRIAGKKLRYRTELLADLGQTKAKPLVQALKQMQATLGDWHDRSVFLHHVAAFIGRPEFPAEHTDIGRILLAELKKERMRKHHDVAAIFQQANKVQQACATWRSNATL